MMSLRLTELVEEASYASTDRQILALSEQIADEMVDYLQSLVGWNIIGGTDAFNLVEENQNQREFYIKRSRVLARREPLSMQAIRLYTTYLGILKVEFKAQNPRYEEIWRRNFWGLKDNKTVLGPLYRKKLARRLLIDGDCFFVLFPSPSGEVRIRTIDTLEIDLITNPEDREQVLFYKRSVFRNGNVETLYYRDKDLTPEELAGIEADHGRILPPDAREEEALVYHVPFEPQGLRGTGLLFSVISYVENYKNFLENRATIVRGLATYIRKITVEGGSLTVKDIASKFASAIATSNSTIDTNPPDAPGSTWVQNRMLDMEQEAPVTNAGEAFSDARIFRQPIASGVGITEANLTGDPSVGNLASQTQMEGPQLQNFLDYQRLWEEVFIELWEYVLQQNGIPNPEGLSVNFPPIVKIPLTELVDSLEFGLRSNLIPVEEASRLLLLELGSKDVDKLLQSRAETETAEEHSDIVPCPECGKTLEQDHGLFFCPRCEKTFALDRKELDDDQ